MATERARRAGDHPIGVAAERTGLSPDHLTALGLALAVPAALAIGAGYLGLGLALLILAAVVLLLLFFVQRYGTAVVGRAFGPVMLLWFLVIAILGVIGPLRPAPIPQCSRPVRDTS